MPAGLGLGWQVGWLVGWLCVAFFYSSKTVKVRSATAMRWALRTPVLAVMCIYLYYMRLSLSRRYI